MINVNSYGFSRAQLKSFEVVELFRTTYTGIDNLLFEMAYTHMIKLLENFYEDKCKLTVLFTPNLRHTVCTNKKAFMAMITFLNGCYGIGVASDSAVGGIDDRDSQINKMSDLQTTMAGIRIEEGVTGDVDQKDLFATTDRNKEIYIDTEGSFKRNNCIEIKSLGEKNAPIMVDKSTHMDVTPEEEEQQVRISIARSNFKPIAHKKETFDDYLEFREILKYNGLLDIYNKYKGNMIEIGKEHPYEESSIFLEQRKYMASLIIKYAEE